MRSDEIWRHQYRLNRYLDHLSTEEFQQRFKDIFLNILVLTEEAKIGLPPVNAESMQWMEKFTHALEEMQLRNGPYPAGLENGFMRDFEHPSPLHGLASKAGKAVANSSFKLGDGLIKYGGYKHLKKAYESGIVRVAPAATYNDPSLNSAIKDNELEIWVQPHPSSYKVELIDKGKNANLQILNNKITTRSETNYYVYCLSLTFAPRLFVDFEADACLIITKPVVFVNRLIKAMKHRLPDWLSGGGAVSYIDPVRPLKLVPEPIFCKHFRYAYQQEFRLVWLPPVTKDELPYLELNLGSLKDCCELISLDSV